MNEIIEKYQNPRGVYKITNKKNGLIYIGVSQNCNDRIKQHLWELKRGEHFNNELQEDFNKYGENNFKFNIIYEANIDEDLNDLEQYFISNYKSCYKTYGYNRTNGGGYYDYEYKKNSDDSLSWVLEFQQYNDLLIVLSLLSSGVDFALLENSLRVIELEESVKMLEKAIYKFEKAYGLVNHSLDEWR